MQNATFDDLAQALREMSDRFGASAFVDRRRLVSLLSDKFPENRREINLIASAVDEKVFEEVAHAPVEQRIFEIERQAARLEAALGIRHDLAQSVVSCAAYAVGVGPLPTAAPQTPAEANAATPPTARLASQPQQEGSWVGLSSVAGRPNSWVGGSNVSGQGAVAATAAPPSALAGAHAGPAAGFFTGWSWRKRALVGAGGLVLLGLVLSRFIVEVPVPQPTTPTQPTLPPPIATPRPPAAVPPIQAPPAQPPVAQRPAVQPSPRQYYADEATDWGVPSQNFLQSQVAGPTPTSVPGAHTVYTVDIVDAAQRGQQMLLIDVWNGYHPRTITSALYAPYAGLPGNFNDANQQRLRTDLQSVLNRMGSVPVVFFCAGSRCWESYNAALRAVHAGFQNIYWYRGGIAAWEAARGPEMVLNGNP